MWSLLFCGLSIALPLSVRADGCKDIFMRNEMPSANQPFAFNCTFPPVTSGEVSVTWYKNSSKIPVSKSIQSRIHQDETWILFLPIALGDSGIYQCVIKGRDSCHRIHVNLTVFEKHWCDISVSGLPNLSDEYKQILHVGKDDSLTCHLHFPKSCILDSTMWYKDCNEIKGERFTRLETKLFVSNVSPEDRGNYVCQTILLHSGKKYRVLNGITVSTTPDFRAHLIGGLIALMAVAVSVVYIYNIFKIDIVLWYRSAFHPTGTIEDGKLYDAYVLYPKPHRESQRHAVDALVLKILPEVLERQCGYKLFIFSRDEFPGQAVANVIDENVKLCRRLMVIVVPESLGFGLLKNLPEEQIAVYNALIQDGMKVILIELEKIEDYTAMPESIQYIKQKHGAIQWQGDFTEHSQCAKTKFWKTVRYHMPPRRCPPSPPVQLLQHTPCNCMAGERMGGGHEVRHALVGCLSLSGGSQLEEDAFHQGSLL
ncbi:interleukin-1 receptor-like 2 isoform X3 [Aotus nancymaae]|uniref:interleukin-1 receptor-like 2 isoform X3 n=1 Tax=Aotus nancymaae TaxID=37293 RepID=UPI0030FE2524